MMARRLQPHRIFFPAALALALLLVPLKAAEMTGALALSYLPAYWHGHEMLAGFAYALVGGYLLAGQGRRQIALAFAAWLAGRIAILAPGLPAPVMAALLLAYPLALAAYAAAPFAKSAKTGRNAVFAAVIGAFTVAELIYLAGLADLIGDSGRGGVMLAAGLVLLLLFTMGGRILAAATSGALQKRDIRLRGAAQPRLERAGLACLVPMAVLDAVGILPAIAATLGAAGGIVILLRLHHWRAWQVLAAEVSFLHLGYLWLAAGLLLRFAALIGAPLVSLDALHAAFAGGLGTLGLTMIARVARQRARRPVTLPAPIKAALAFVSLATALRVFALATPAGTELIWASSLIWSIACLIVLLKGEPAVR